MADLEIGQALALLERLKEVVAAFAKREETLTRSLEARRSGTAWRHQSGLEGNDEALKARLAEVETEFTQETARIKKIARDREARVQRVSAQALRTLPRRAREARGNWLANLQMRLREAENQRAASLHEAEANAGQVMAALAEDGRRLILLKRAARKAFTGYRTFRGKLRETGTGLEGTAGADALPLVEEALADAEERLAEFGQFVLPRIFQYVPPPVAGGLCAVIGGIVAWHFHFSHGGDAAGAAAALGLLGALFAVHLAGKGQAELAAQALAGAVVKAEQLYDAAGAHATHLHDEAVRLIEEEYAATHAEISGQWNRVDEVETEHWTKGRQKIEAQTPPLLVKIREREVGKQASLATGRQARLIAIREEIAAQREEAARTRETEVRQWDQEEAEGWQKLEADWQRAIQPLYAEIREMQARSEASFPAWSEDWIERWTPPETFPAGAKFAAWQVDLKTLAGALPRDARLALPGPAEFSLPLALNFPRQGSLLIEAKESAQPAVIGLLNALVLRLLAGSPPGKIAFTIVDPVGLGQNFAGLMYLADYDESLISRRIWTQQGQIEERLAELNEHIEKMIQMYLRNEYETITQYNEKAGSVAEKYHFLVVADFPAQFSETAARRLQSIAASGPRCGVFTLIQWDHRQTPPEALAIEELRKSSVIIHRGAGGYFLPGLQPEGGTKLLLDAPPDRELEAKLVNQTGKSSIDSNRVQVPFAQIAPAPDELWTNDTTQELKIAIGRTGATKPQYLAIGKGTKQHALFAGKTGSGKSTLFHVIITNLALACSPKQVEFYLIDFKKGVEFKCYAEKRLPHARVVAIESDREFALSVLHRVDEELRRRGDLFRKLGVQDLQGYRKAGGAEEIPRTLLIIDEFQEFFVEDDAVAQNASLLFDRIVRQGRAFGIHVLLGSQTLGGAYTLARATLGQMVIRVALQCNEADAYLIMDDNNSAPRLLSRPGEGIYNDAAGAVEGNSPFQVVWLPEEERDACLDRVHELAVEHGIKAVAPIVFEGNAPADVRDNPLLEELLETTPAAAPETARTWLGAPNSIKGPTEVVFHRQGGNHLLVVGQREEAALSMLGLSLLALGAQYPAGKARFVFFQGTTDGTEIGFVDAIAGALPHEVTIVPAAEAVAAMNELAAELKQRTGSGAYGAEPIFVFVQGLQKFKKLRHEDEFSISMSDEAASPGAQFDELIREGSAYGMHLLVAVDSYSNVARFISRKALTEFEMRVVFQMSANDSASLIDSPRAGALGLHRALFFNEREGTLETFRPFALPDRGWLEQAIAKLAGRAGGINGAPEMKKAAPSTAR